MSIEFRETVSKRFPLLHALSEAAKTKPELVDALDCSRSTIDRAINELLDIGCIERQPADRSQFRLTPTGTVAVQIEADYRADVQTLRESTDLLNSLPADAPLSDAFVSGAELYQSSHAPDIALQPGTNLLEDAETMVGTATVVRRDYLEGLQSKLDAGGFDLELVVGPELLEATMANHRREFVRLLKHDAVTIYAADAELPYALWLMEHDDQTTAGMTVHEDGGVKGTLVNDATSAVTWAQTQYATFRDNATELRQLAGVEQE